MKLVVLLALITFVYAAPPASVNVPAAEQYLAVDTPGNHEDSLRVARQFGLGGFGPRFYGGGFGGHHHHHHHGFGGFGGGGGGFHHHHHHGFFG